MNTRTRVRMWAAAVGIVALGAFTPTASDATESAATQSGAECPTCIDVCVRDEDNEDIVCLPWGPISDILNRLIGGSGSDG